MQRNRTKAWGSSTVDALTSPIPVIETSLVQLEESHHVSLRLGTGTKNIAIATLSARKLTGELSTMSPLPACHR